MKVETKKKFIPMTITIVIESEDELRSMWHRLHVGLEWLRKRFKGSSQPVVKFPLPEDNGDSQHGLTDALFDALDAECLVRGIRGRGKVK